MSWRQTQAYNTEVSEALLEHSDAPACSQLNLQREVPVTVSRTMLAGEPFSLARGFLLPKPVMILAKGCTILLEVFCWLLTAEELNARADRPAP